MLRFSANLGFLWRELPLVDRIFRAKQAGFDAVEFHYPYEVEPAAIHAALRETGLPAVGINTKPGNQAAGELGLSALPGRSGESHAAIQEAVDYAKAIRAGAVHVLAGKTGGGAEAERVYREALEYAAELAVGAALTILIEPINQRDAPGYQLRSVEHAATIVSELKRDNLKILFDCYHAQITGGDLIQRLKKHLPLIGHVQIAAVPSRAEPDEGEVAYDRLLPALDAMGYEGFVGAEYHARTNVEAGLGWLREFRSPAKPA